MSGNLLASVFSSGNVISVTVGTDSTFDPKTGSGGQQYGFASAANALNGVTIGAVSPTTLLGATINGIFELDTTPSGPNNFKLILNGNQTSLSISQAVTNGHTFTFGAPSFSGGQTTWTATGLGSNPFGGSPVNVTLS